MPRTSEYVLEARSENPRALGAADALELAARRHLVRRRVLRLSAQTIVFIALVLVFFFRVPQVEGRSMQPNVAKGNHVLINTLAYGLAIGPAVFASRRVSRGDVVAFERGRGDDRKILLKRVVALPGESVAIVDGNVVINGEPLHEDYDPLPDRSTMTKILVPEGTVFVLGDNRAASDDSRLFGPISRSSIIGKAMLIVWPPGNVKQIR